HGSDSRNKVRCAWARLIDCRRILVAGSIVQSHVVFDFVLILPIQSRRVSPPVTHSRAITEDRRVNHACCKVGEVHEPESAARRPIQETLGIFTPELIAPAPRMFRTAEWRNPRHVIE